MIPTIRRMMGRALLMCTLSTGLTWAENGAGLVERRPVEHSSRWKKAWAWSAAALAASVAVDSASSMGRPEMNPLLRGSMGQFSARSAGLKFSIAGVVLGSQYLFLKRHPEQAAWATTGNFAAAGLTAGVAVRNFRLPR